MAYSFCTTPDKLRMQVAISCIIAITICRGYFGAAISFGYLIVGAAHNIETSFVSVTFWILKGKSSV